MSWKVHLEAGSDETISKTALETTLHSWCLRLDKERMLNKVHYATCDGRGREDHGYITEKSQVSGFPRDENTWKVDGKTRPRTEQKSVEMMIRIVGKFVRGWDFAIDPCTGPLSTSNACVMHPWHKSVVSSDIDEECTKDATPSLPLVFCRQSLKADLDI